MINLCWRGAMPKPTKKQLKEVYKSLQAGVPLMRCCNQAGLSTKGTDLSGMCNLIKKDHPDVNELIAANRPAKQTIASLRDALPQRRIRKATTVEALDTIIIELNSFIAMAYDKRKNVDV